MDRNEAQSILGRHSPFPLYDPAEPAVYKDWVIDAMLEAVRAEREACAKVCTDIWHDLCADADTNIETTMAVADCAYLIGARSGLLEGDGGE